MDTQVIILAEKEDGIALIELKSEALRIVTTNLGCHIISVYAKDKEGNIDDVVLGLQNVKDYQRDKKYIGAILGRVANRIGGASFELNGEVYALHANDGDNHLHGGAVGFDQKIFSYSLTKQGVCFHCKSPDGEEGYPGNLCLDVQYSLVKNRFCISYHAVSDQDTLVNFSNHMYFNLSGGKEKIYHHQLQIASDRIACTDKHGLTNGDFLDVADTPFDFRYFHEIGERIDSPHPQIAYAKGYDHSFELKQPKDQIILSHSASGRKLMISTTMPHVQVYTGNYLAGGCMGKSGVPYADRDGIALETQFLPNSIHIEKPSRTILRKEQDFWSETCYCFETEK